ncbi:VOC family protein [Enterovibrio sp. ZSDZ35]|uniref:VOC family protein n=1 Tax=Enterovibrio qingdaonensis TaxID=2899818 RepID=A0ABT5QRJ1_9GAMM|nr:VOC family protein [Enterovibrio sp. ZSDZ35]MDD1783611.1 VOC family protein [Enterovibrio sp. ZSDZ35]
MLNHVSVGTNQFQPAVKFYDAVMGALSIERSYLIENTAAAYGVNFEFWVTLPCNNKASAGNGVHVAFTAPSNDAVDAFYLAAMELGGSCEGKPGFRPEYGPTYYAAYVKDLDGNKIEAVSMT